MTILSSIKKKSLRSSKLYSYYPAGARAEANRLKNEKFDLINEMKELYEALDDKEKQLRDFIRNYEHVSIMRMFT